MSALEICRFCSEGKSLLPCQYHLLPFPAVSEVFFYQPPYFSATLERGERWKENGLRLTAHTFLYDEYGTPLNRRSVKGSQWKSTQSRTAKCFLKHRGVFVLSWIFFFLQWRVPVEFGSVNIQGDYFLFAHTFWNHHIASMWVTFCYAKNFSCYISQREGVFEISNLNIALVLFVLFHYLFFKE